MFGCNRKSIGVTIAAGLIASGVAFAPAPVAAAPTRGGLYDNCTNYNNRFPHGVGKAHAHDHTSGTAVTNFRRSNRLYHRAMNHNSDLDRDRDRIACEKA